MSYVRYVYIRLHSEVKRQFLFISVNFRLASNLRKKKIMKWNSEKVYLVVCGCLLVVCGRLWSFVVVCWWFLVVCGGLWGFVVVTCFSNYTNLFVFPSL